MANSYTVKRVWSENLDVLKTSGQEVIASECKSLSNQTFRCEATTKKRAARSAQILFFNGKTDLVAISVDASSKIQNVGDFLRKIKLHTISKKGRN